MPIDGNSPFLSNVSRLLGTSLPRAVLRPAALRALRDASERLAAAGVEATPTNEQLLEVSPARPQRLMSVFAKLSGAPDAWASAAEPMLELSPSVASRPNRVFKRLMERFGVRSVYAPTVAQSGGFFDAELNVLGVDGTFVESVTSRDPLLLHEVRHAALYGDARAGKPRTFQLVARARSGAQLSDLGNDEVGKVYGERCSAQEVDAYSLTAALYKRLIRRLGQLVAAGEIPAKDVDPFIGLLVQSAEAGARIARQTELLTEQALRALERGELLSQVTPWELDFMDRARRAFDPWDEHLCVVLPIRVEQGILALPLVVSRAGPGPWELYRRARGGDLPSKEALLDVARRQLRHTGEASREQAAVLGQAAAAARQSIRAQDPRVSAQALNQAFAHVARSRALLRAADAALSRKLAA